MGVITSIRQNKHNKERCSVFVDEEYLAACPIDVSLGLGLKKGMEMTPELEAELRRQDQTIVLKQKVYRFATYKTRSAKQVEDALKRYGATDEECVSIVAWLKEFRLIDDAAYAKSFVEASIDRKPLSIRDAKRRLAIKGISAELAERAIEESYDDETELHAATCVAVKKARSIRGTSQEKKQKLIRFLTYRQFSWPTIQKVLESLPADILRLAALFALLSTNAISQTNDCLKERLPESINSFQPTTLPVLGPNGDLYLDRKLHPDNRNGITDTDDLWIASPRSNIAWSAPEQRQITTFASPDILFNFTFDGLAALVVGRYDDSSGDSTSCFAIISRQSLDARFSDVKVVRVPGMGPLESNYFGFLSNDQNRLIVAIERPDGLGDLDLYQTSRCADGPWTPLVSLGSDLNTAGMEGAPWLAPDGKTLYFTSSGRLDRRGKADLYVTRREGASWSKWTTPVSLGDCINTAEDETAISLVGRGDTILLTSWDIESKRAGIYKAMLPAELRPSPVCTLMLVVRDAQTQLPISQNSMAQLSSPSEELCSQTILRRSSESGIISSILHERNSYTITTSCPGYVSHTQVVTVEKLDSTVELRVNVELFPTNLPIFSVYFDKGLNTLTSEQMQRLDSALAVYDVRNLSFSVSGYTDGIGTELINRTLSQQRAVTVRNELLRYGIPASRITARGKGIEKQATLGADDPTLRRVDVYPTPTNSD